MALPTPSISIDSISSDRLTGVLLDSSVYTSPARSAVGVFASGYKMNSNNTVASTLTLTGDTSDPETDSEWTFNIPVDGWFRFLFVIVPDFDTSDTYEIYDAVFDPSTNSVYRSKQNNNTTDSLADTAWWEEITDPSSLASNEGEANESTNIESTVYEVVLTPNAEYLYGNIIADASETCCSVDCSLESLFTYIRLGAILDGAYVAGDRGNYPSGEIKMRKFESLAESLS